MFTKQLLVGAPFTKGARGCLSSLIGQKEAKLARTQVLTGKPRRYAKVNAYVRGES